MAKPELTKLLIAQTVKNLALQKPLEKISVGDITEAAGINRKTFYYHFADKQELVCWIFDYETNKITDKNGNNTILDDIIEYIYSEREFYSEALTSDVQNNLGDHIYTACFDRMLYDIKRLLNGRQLSEHQIQMSAALFTHGITGMLIHWAKNGMKEDFYPFILEYSVSISRILELTIDSYTQNPGV